MRSPKRMFMRLVMLIATSSVSLPLLAQIEDPLLASLKKTGQVKVALGSAPPNIALSPDGKTATGNVVDAVNLALKGMGLPALTPVFTAWGAMIPGLVAHQFDFVGGLSITEARCKVVTFSAPVYAFRNALYTSAGNPKRLMTVAQVAGAPTIKLAVVAGSSSEANALGQGVKPEQLVRVTDVQAGAATVTGGRADAVLMGQFAIPNPEQKGLEVVVDEQGPVEGFGVVFRKEDVRFRDEFNKQLDLLRSSGTWKELYANKYGLPNWDTLAKLTKASDVAPSCE